MIYNLIEKKKGNKRICFHSYIDEYKGAYLYRKCQKCSKKVIYKVMLGYSPIDKEFMK